MEMAENRKPGRLYLYTISVNLMSMVGGMGFSWPSPFIPILNGSVDPDKNPLAVPTTTAEDAWITSLHTLGSIFAPLFTGILSNRFGRKIVLIMFSLPMMIAYLILAFANTVTHFYVARFLLGLGTGCVLSLIPAYVSEISETQNRGETSLIMPLMMNVIQLSVYMMAPYMTISTQAIISLIPQIIFLVHFGLFGPESPYYYVLRGKLQKAELSLMKLRQTSEVKREFLEIVRNIEETKVKISIRELYASKVIWKCVLITVGLMFFQQFSGILAIVSYLQTIFDSAGVSLPGHICVMIVGVVQTLTVAVTVFVVEKINRKTLMVFSYTGMLLSLSCLGTYFYFFKKGYDVSFLNWVPIAGIMVYIFSFNVAAGGVTWTIVGEIFPPNTKSVMNSFAASFVQTLAFLVSFVFPLVSEYLGIAWSLWIFAICLCFGVIFLILFLPETRKKAFLDIQIMLHGGHIEQTRDKTNRELTSVCKYTCKC